MIVALDIDDTFLDMNYMLERTNNTGKRLSDEEFVKMVKTNANLLKPREYALEAAIKMYELSKNPIVFITAREPILYNITNSNLQDVIKGKFKYKLHVMGKKTEKSVALREEHVTYYADDHPHFILQTFKYVKKVFFVRSEKISKDPNFGKINNIVAVNNLMEMYEQIK